MVIRGLAAFLQCIRISLFVLLFSVSISYAEEQSCQVALSKVLPEQLKITSYNVENLFILPAELHARDRNGQMSNEEFEQLNEEARNIGKPFKRHRVLLNLANVIKHLDSDILVLQETDKETDSLSRFANEYLNNEYQFFSIPGNDERGINISFLVKKSLPLFYRITSHKDETWRDPTNNLATELLFRRDFPMLEIFTEDPTEKSIQPTLAVFGIHFKSRRRGGNGDNGMILRQAESYRAAQIVRRYEEQWQHQVPILVAGDFNGEVRSSSEYEGFRSIGLSNTLDLLQLNATTATMKSPLSRGTNLFRTKRSMILQEFDHIFINQTGASYLSGGSLYRPGFPQNTALTKTNIVRFLKRDPSDHMPVSILFALRDFINSNRDQSLENTTR